MEVKMESPEEHINPTPEKPLLKNRDTLVGSLRGALAEVVQTLLLAAGIYVLVNLALPRYLVEGRSMQPIFNGMGEERVIVNRLEYLISDPQRGDIIVLENPADHAVFYIKRILGLPGEIVTMEEGKVYIDGDPIDEPYIMELCSSSRCNDKTWTLGDDQYFVLGDNRNNSHDSTAFGPIERSLIVGRAWLHYWPPEEWKIFDHYAYSGQPE
jgi:signal peptidase I